MCSHVLGLGKAERDKDMHGSAGEKRFGRETRRCMVGRGEEGWEGG